MTRDNLKYLKIGFLVLMATYAIFGMVSISWLFSYLNQSSLTPEDEQLTVFNYLFPLIVTLGFTVYFPIQVTQKPTKLLHPKILWIELLIIGLLASVAIPWQMRHILWQLDQPDWNIFATAPYVIGLLFTIGVLTGVMKKTITHHNNSSHSTRQDKNE